MALSVVCAPLVGRAQATYRCGNTYSQTPCSTGAAPAAIHKDVAAAPAAAVGGVAPVGVELCKRAALAGLKDPYTAIVQSVSAPVGAVVTIAECFLSMDGRRLLQANGY